MPGRPSLIAFVSLLALAGCSDLPDLDDTVSDQARAADYPRLAPLDELLSETGSEQTALADLETLEMRAAGLSARADRLRGPVVDETTRAKLLAAVERRPQARP